MSVYYIPGIDLDAGTITGNKRDIVSAFLGLTSWCGWEDGERKGWREGRKEKERQNISE